MQHTHANTPVHTPVTPVTCIQSAFQCAALYCSVCCGVLQCVAVCCSHMHTPVTCIQSVLQCAAVCCSECCSMLQCVAVCCSVLQYVAVCCSMLQHVAVCCHVLQCALVRVAVCFSVLQFVAVTCTRSITCIPSLQSGGGAPPPVNVAEVAVK